MLYEWLYPLASHWGVLNLFQYITFRSGGALMTALLMSFISGPYVIRWLKSKQASGQPIRSDGPETHLLKQGTPTMGGLMMLSSMGVSTLLWMDLSNQFVWLVLAVTFGYGLIGGIDDYLKLTKRSSDGLPGKLKLAGQAGIALGFVLAVEALTPEAIRSQLSIPYFKDVWWMLGVFYIPFAMIVLMGASNAVNLTDGLDGLAIVPIMIAAASFGLISYLVGHAVFSGYLNIPSVPGSGELAIICAALIGAGLGFLWYNAPPAMVFMGDTGSLAFGGTLGAIAVITKFELVLAIIGGLFVMEALSVMIQVFSYKTTGKRVFRMAPVHHHFEKKGWQEPTIVIRFWIIAVILALVGLASLKIR